MLNIKNKMISDLHIYLEDVTSKYEYSHVLKQAISYTMLNWGKLFRPVLTLMIIEDLKVSYKKGLEFAAAVEMVHVGGLLHDDLPALDDGRYRRKKLVNHLVYGEAQTILSGDGLIADAFLEIASSDIDAKRVVELIKLMSNMIGPNGYVGGQSLDIAFENEAIEYISEEQLKKIHFGKTGALIKASIIGGGIIGGASKEQLALLDTLAYEVGLAFQIRDDIIDVTRNEQEAGKDTKSDMKKDKATYPKFYGLSKSYDLLDNHVNNILNVVTELFGDDSYTFKYLQASLVYKK